MINPVFITVVAPFVFSLANFLGIYFLGKKFIEVTREKIQEQVTRATLAVRCDISEVKAEVAARFANKSVIDDARHDILRQDIAAAHETVKSQAEHLTQQAEIVKAHAQQIIDARSQHETATGVSRARCGKCGRTVYKFERQPDGTATCLDCISRS
jgi:hypothetical protein